MVKELTKENFEKEVLQAKGRVLVKFAAKAGCQPCIDFKPQFEAASSDESYKFCAYERETLRGTPLDEIETKYGIERFPTVLAFENGEVKGKMPKYKFLSDRELHGLILDEQKKEYTQRCYVEDLMGEAASRIAPPPISVEQCQAECEVKCGEDEECKRGCVAHCNPEARKALEEHLKEIKE